MMLPHAQSETFLLDADGDDIGDHRCKKMVFMTQEEGGEEDQERRVKRRTCPAYDQREREKVMEPSKIRERDTPVTKITNLAEDVVFHILDKLLEPIDHFCFAAVCKEWRCVAKDYNQRWWRSKAQLLPMLMMPPNGTANDSSSEQQQQQTKQRLHRLLYSVSERKIYNNIRLAVPYNDKCCGSSYGWLASTDKSIMEISQREVEVIHQITLRNPFRKALEAIHLPPYRQKLPKVDYVYEWIPNVILSADPTLHPDNYYVVLVFYRPIPNTIKSDSFTLPLAFIKGGQESWISIKQSTWYYPKYDDAIFYRNKVYLVHKYGYSLITIDLNSSNNLTEKRIPYKPRSRPHGRPPREQYLVESTKGDLLLVQRILQTETSFMVSKFIFSDKDKYSSTAQLVEVKSIGDDAIFLGQSHSVSVLASNIPGCQPNSIYYVKADVKRVEYAIRFDCQKSEMGIFNLEDRTVTPLLDPDSMNAWNWNNINMPLWILPSFD